MGQSDKSELVDRRKVLTKALINAAELTGLKQSTIGKIVGLSAPTMTRMYGGTYLLKSSGKEWDAARLFIRLYRGLDAITAGDERSLKSWMRSDNLDLRAKPIDLIKELSGLVHTVDYVDAYRAKV
ncbi:MAG: antitoxin Xre/MbcA/ParS toxin-binding domain-containing protein [Thiohalomonadales bacterium]